MGTPRERSPSFLRKASLHTLLISTLHVTSKLHVTHYKEIINHLIEFLHDTVGDEKKLALLRKYEEAQKSDRVDKIIDSRRKHSAAKVP